MGPDHPVTGGYLQPMTVLRRERWKLARLAPGERVRFASGAAGASPAGE
jgi:urea carboxylase